MRTLFKRSELGEPLSLLITESNLTKKLSSSWLYETITFQATEMFLKKFGKWWGTIYYFIPLRSVSIGERRWQNRHIHISIPLTSKITSVKFGDRALARFFFMIFETPYYNHRNSPRLICKGLWDIPSRVWSSCTLIFLESLRHWSRELVKCTSFVTIECIIYWLISNTYMYLL